MYAFAGRVGIVPESTNPARGMDKFKESRRERFLTGGELQRLGSAIREAEKWACLPHSRLNLLLNLLKERLEARREADMQRPDRQ